MLRGWPRPKVSRLCWFRWIVVVNKELGCSLYLSLSFSLCYSLPSLFVSLKEMSVDKMIGIICYGGLERERERERKRKKITNKYRVRKRIFFFVCQGYATCLCPLPCDMYVSPLYRFLYLHTLTDTDTARKREKEKQREEDFYSGSAPHIYISEKWRE